MSVVDRPIVEDEVEEVLAPQAPPAPPSDRGPVRQPTRPTPPAPPRRRRRVWAAIAGVVGVAMAGTAVVVTQVGGDTQTVESGDPSGEPGLPPEASEPRPTTPPAPECAAPETVTQPYAVQVDRASAAALAAAPANLAAALSSSHMVLNGTVTRDAFNLDDEYLGVEVRMDLFGSDNLLRPWDSKIVVLKVPGQRLDDGTYRIPQETGDVFLEGDQVAATVVATDETEIIDSTHPEFAPHELASGAVLAPLPFTTVNATRVAAGTSASFSNDPPVRAEMESHVRSGGPRAIVDASRASGADLLPVDPANLAPFQPTPSSGLAPCRAVTVVSVQGEGENALSFDFVLTSTA